VPLSRWTKLVVAAGLLVLPSTAALAATIEMIIIPCEPPLRDDECGVKVNAISGTATFTSSSGETVTVSSGQALSISGTGIMSQSAQDGTMLNFASAGSSSQTGSTGGEGAGAGGGGGGGQTAGLPSGGGGGGGGGSASSGSGSSGSGGGSSGGGGGGGSSGGGGGGSSGGPISGGGGTSGVAASSGPSEPTTTSDLRLKHDIALLGRLDNGLGFYRFVYNGENEAYVGVMAQEVEAVVPEAVVTGPDGYLRVRYGKLGVKFETYNEWLASGAKIPSTRQNPPTE
jgi:hypothetical protein